MHNPQPVCPLTKFSKILPTSSSLGFILLSIDQIVHPVLAGSWQFHLWCSAIHCHPLLHKAVYTLLLDQLNTVPFSLFKNGGSTYSWTAPFLPADTTNLLSGKKLSSFPWLALVEGECSYHFACCLVLFVVLMFHYNSRCLLNLIKTKIPCHFY